MGPLGRVGRLTRLAKGAARRALYAGAGTIAVVAILLAPIEICPFALLFHAPCPGCGLTRAAVAMVHGNMREALRLHPLSFVLVPLALGILTNQLVRYIVANDFWSARARTWVLWEIGALALLVALIGVWVARFFGYLGGPVSI